VGYGLVDQGSIPDTGNDGNFSLRHRVQTVCGTHSASCPMGTGVSYDGGKVTRA
jgi:ribosomal protein L32